TPRFTYSFVTTLKGICPFGLRSSKLTSVAVTGGGMSCAPALPTSAVSSRALAIRTVLIRSPQFPDVVQRWTSDLVAGAAVHRDDSPGLASGSSHGVTLLKAPDLKGFAAGSGGLSMRRGHLRHARRRAGRAGTK